MTAKNFTLISKTIFFPELKILAVGDLHLGYEQMLREQGIILPFKQLETTENEIKNIINKIGKEKIKKIIFLGDIKHYFKFKKEEKFEVRNFIDFLRDMMTDCEVILIEGNHDRIQFKEFEYRKFYIERKIAFTHGDKLYKEIFDDKIKTIVISHIHPAVSIREKKGIKMERYKAFLIGEYKKKEVIVVPSFLPLTEGTEINWKYEDKFSIIPKRQLQNFNVFAVGDERIFEFGKLKDLKEGV